MFLLKFRKTFRQSLYNGRNVDALIASEKEIWHKEKLSLQQSLKQAETELAKLRAELRNEAFLRELGSDSENAALKVKNFILTIYWTISSVIRHCTDLLFTAICNQMIQA